MKLNKTIVTLALAFVACASISSPLVAAEKKLAGPNGGRVIASGLDPRAEFFVRPDRKIQITFLDAAGKPVPPAEQSVTVTAGDRMNPSTLKFSRSANMLVSDAPLPAGNAVPTVVQIKPTLTAKTVTAKFNADLSTCGECKHAEYACTCDH